MNILHVAAVPFVKRKGIYLDLIFDGTILIIYDYIVLVFIKYED